MLGRVLVVAIAAAAVGCASTSSVHWDRPVAPGGTQAGERVFVMVPTVDGSAVPGNVGRDFEKIRTVVVTRLVAVVNQRYPGADVAEPGPPAAFRVLPGYAAAVTGIHASREEFDAARIARDHGATHLLVPTITQWTENRTDDPVGALTAPHNRIALTLRLMRLEPPGVAGIVTFTNHARVTVNQPAERLLDERFQNAVLALLSGG
jgi:hypothetical protein